MSKAFATVRENDGEVSFLELALAKQAGEDGLVYPVTSSLWIADDGRIHLGKAAVEKSLHASPIERKRFDSLKQQLSQGLTQNPDEVRLLPAVNPTDVPLTEADAIILYLAYLTDLALTDLSERHGRSRYVRRRFALPCWDQGRRAWGEALLKKYLSYSQVVADTFHGKWRDGIPARDAKAVLDEVKGLGTGPDYLVAEGVLEPIAAGESRFRYDDERMRGLAMVVDVGAGTTDFALFLVAQPEDGVLRVAPIKGCSQAVRQAGDSIDNILRVQILKQANVHKGDPSYDRVNAALQLRIREYKERLFSEKSLTYALENDATGRIQLEIFLETEEVKAFGKLLSDKFSEVLNAASATFYERLAEGGLSVVMTGGGATLPMVKSLAEERSIVHGFSLYRRGAPLVPDIHSEKLGNEYPQLAVAIGGASPELPKEFSELSEMPGLARMRWKVGGFFTKGT